MKADFTLKMLLVVGLAMMPMLLFLDTSNASSQMQPTAVPIVQTVPVPTPTPTETFTLEQRTGDLLNTYKEVLDTSKSTIEELHTTTNRILNWVGILFSLLTVAGLGGATLLSWFGQKASDRASAAQQKALEALDVIHKTEMRTTELEKRNDKALESTNELTQKQNTLLLQIDAAEKLLHSLQVEILQLKSSGESDRQVIKKPLALIQIDEYIMQALSGSPVERNNSILALVEMSSRSEAVVQRRAVKALGALDEYDERAAKQLKHLIDSDIPRGVRKEAEKSLKLIETKKTKNPPRRKS